MNEKRIKEEVVKALVFFTKQPYESFDLSMEHFSYFPWVDRNYRGENCIVPTLLAMYIIQNYSILNIYGTLAIYEDGYFQKMNDTEWKAFIKAFMPKEYRKRRDWEDVLEELKTEYPVSENQLDTNENIVNFKNGIVLLDSGELVPHDPKYISTIQLNANYISNAKIEDAPTINRYLDCLCTTEYAMETSDVDNDTKTLLLEFAGAVFSCVKGSRYKKCLMLYGPSGAGKTQYRQLIINILGKGHSLSLDLYRMQGAFGTGQIQGKRLLGTGDLPKATLPEMSVLKNLTGGDEIMIEAKYRDMYSGEFRGWLLYCANDLPHFGGNGEAIYNRFMIVPCTNVIPAEKRDPQLLDKMMRERDIFVSVALDKFRETTQRGYKFTESDAIIAERKHYQAFNDSLASFVTEHCILGEKRMKRSTFNIVYQAWCRENSYYTVPRNSIAKKLHELYGIEAVKINGEYYYDIKIDYSTLDKSEVDYLYQGYRY